MWEQTDLWKAYCEHFDTIESARNEWSEKALEFLNMVCSSVADKSWAQDADLILKPVAVENRTASANVDFSRLSNQFDLHSPRYKYEISIGFKAKPDGNSCNFMVSAHSYLKRGESRGALLKEEARVVRQFVEEENDGAYMITGRKGSFRYRFIDAASDQLTVDHAARAVKETLDATKRLNKLLEASAGAPS